tara:strand:+ start:882 stop:1397 length:516 start_codon:yes stop_codon:yes gene_type:complete
MEQFNQDDWIWIGIAPDTDDCMFCGKVYENSHLSSCPSNMVSVHEGAISLWTHMYDDYRSEEDYAKDVGKQLMMAADQVIKAQKDWAKKTTLQKMEEVFNNWGVITEFADVLFDLGLVNTPSEVIDYYKNPTIYDKEFVLWEEYEYPFPDDEAWQEFVLRLDLPNNGETRI